MLNKVTLIGNLGADPEITHMPSGDAVATTTIATTRKWKDKSGEKKEATEWHRVIFFSKLADIVGKYLKKGNKVYVEGRLQTRKWQDNNGVDRYTTEIIANEMIMLSGSSDNSENNKQKTKSNKDKTENTEDYNDDIPF